MAENDIYHSKERFEKFKTNIKDLLNPPKAGSKRKYHIHNPNNLKHYSRLMDKFQARDISYIRRLRVLQTFNLITASTEQELSQCDRDEIDRIVSHMHEHYLSTKSKRDFLRDIKFIWKLLFPEKDAKGRVDDEVFPYPVRHIKASMDKSREKRRSDRLSWEEYEQLVAHFDTDLRMQCYITLACESLARPQEMLYLRIKDIRLSEDYAKIELSEHGKEGIKLLQCMDSFPYLQKWLAAHPLKKDEQSLLFPNLNRANYGNELRPEIVSNKIRAACKKLGITKKITAYSLKRNGITFRRLRGESDAEIMHAAGWTSTKQLKTYDLSEQQDAFKMALARRGLIKDETLNHLQPAVKECWACGHRQGFSNDYCEQCKRPLKRELIQLQVARDTQIRADMAEWQHPDTQAIFQALKNPEVLQAIKNAVSLQHTGQPK